MHIMKKKATKPITSEDEEVVDLRLKPFFHVNCHSLTQSRLIALRYAPNFLIPSNINLTYTTFDFV